MPIISLDHLMRRTTNGYSYRADWLLTTNIAAAASKWMDMSRVGVQPSPNLYPATNGSLTWVNCDSSSGFGLPLGPQPTGDETKHIFMATALSTVTTGVPAMLTLVDLQGYWPDISLTTTSPQTLSGTPSLRYTNGVGCIPYLVVTAGTGATSQNLSMSYTNQAGTGGRGLPFTYTIAATTSIGYVYNFSGASWFLPLSSSDTGVQNIASVTWSAANTTGTVALCLARPLLSIPIATLGNIVERDYVNQLPSLPQVKNGACLVWLYHPGATTVINSNFYGAVEYVWG